MSNLILEIKNLSHSYGETNQVIQNINLEIEKSDREKLPSMISFISSNSKTADIEKTLVNGAHGPKELYLLLV